VQRIASPYGKRDRHTDTRKVIFDERGRKIDEIKVLYE
jgi:hypothetical protein